MKILLSPAKLMRILPQDKCTSPLNLAQAQDLQKILTKWSLKDFQQKMKLSEAKAQETIQMIHDWQQLTNSRHLTPAIDAYIGEAFKALDVLSIDEKARNYFNQNVCILSGLYGLLRSTDGIAPYRLEMAQKITLPKKINSLYAFWRPKIEELLSQILGPDEILLNLASSEYSDLIQATHLKDVMVTPIFKELKNGKLQSVSVFSKQARGKMARWCAENNLNKVQQIKGFQEMGYQFDAGLSDEHHLLFVRKAAQ
ncbi:MAG: peroxide stress protein YaaA [Flavobacteriales bacterium]